MTEKEKQTEIISTLDCIDELRMLITRFLMGMDGVRESQTDPDNWDRMCNSRDIINDTAYAIESYVKSDYPEEDPGLKYIFTYGILQTLFLQQDAVENLFKAFQKHYQQGEEFHYKRGDELREIRKLRNETIGHPIGTKYGSFNYIDRSSLSKWFFKWSRSSKESGNELLPVDLFSVLKRQTLAIKSDLEILVRKIEEADKMRHEKHRDRLMAICKDNIEYLLQTVAEGINSPLTHNQTRALRTLGTIENRYLEFESGMKERGGLEGFYELEDYKRAISVLKEYLAGKNPAIKEEDARIYYFYLQKQHKYFKEMVEEIDSEYTSS